MEWRSQEPDGDGWSCWRREYEQQQAPNLAGLLEFGSEFAATIDLHGANGKGMRHNKELRLLAMSFNRSRGDHR